MKGDWEAAFNTLKGLSSWRLVPKFDQVLQMMKEKLQQEGLRTYLFAYGAYYKSLSHSQLASMFQLPEKTVSSLFGYLPSPCTVSQQEHSACRSFANLYSARQVFQPVLSKCRINPWE